MRPPWRIALFLFFFLFLTVVGQVAVSVLPRHPLQWASLVVMTLAALAAGWIVLWRVDQRPPGALGFPLHPLVVRESLFGVGVGGVLIGIAVLLLLATRAAAFVPDSGTVGGYVGFLGWTFLFFTLAAAFEELLFRGYPFQVLVEWLGAWPAVILASALFSALHGQNPNVTSLALVNIFLAGVLLSWAYLRTRSLWFATGVHVGWNWTMASLFDFPVSGLGFETPLYTGVAVGNEWWTGGAFGPEAGLVGTLVFAAGILWLLRSPAVRAAPHTDALQPLVLRRVEPTEGGRR